MMFRNLRQRLIWSQILPLLLSLPLMGILLIYSLEGQILIPQLAKNLVNDARLLAEISSAEFELWGDPTLFKSLISRVQLDPDIQVTFLTRQGILLYSSDPGDSPFIGTLLALPGLAKAQTGKEIALTNYSILNLGNVVVDVYEPVTNIGGQVIGIIRLTYRLGSLYNIFGQLRWQARAVNLLVEQLHSLESSRRQLLANVVHELGTPLGALRSAIHALGKGAADDPTLLADLTRGMDDETLRLQVLLDELAHLYDKATGSLELNRQPVETGDWLKGVLIPWRAAAQEKHLDWVEEIPATLPSISIDTLRMAQVVGNLLSNAIKYTPAGGNVKISAGVDEKTFWLKVSDTGVGIHADELEKIFLPFYRGDTGRRIKDGMGQGLTIARELVTAHDGKLSVESTTGQGSEFTVTLPL